MSILGREKGALILKNEKVGLVEAQTMIYDAIFKKRISDSNPNKMETLGTSSAERLAMHAKPRERRFSRFLSLQILHISLKVGSIKKNQSQMTSCFQARGEHRSL